MPCNCGGKNKNRQRFQVVLKGGLKITKETEAAALAYSAKHPGSRVIKPS